jgi:hypothetical protein
MSKPMSFIHFVFIDQHILKENKKSKIFLACHKETLHFETSILRNKENYYPRGKESYENSL